MVSCNNVLLFSLFSYQPGEQIEAFVTYATQEGHVFVQIFGGGATRLDELMSDIAEHYSQVLFAVYHYEQSYFVSFIQNLAVADFYLWIACPLLVTSIIN